jgi:hypothetical protein
MNQEPRTKNQEPRTKKKSVDGLIRPEDEYDVRARDQRDSIFKGKTTRVSWELTSEQWRYLAAVYLLVQRGVYLRGLAAATICKLRCGQVRLECESIIRSYRFTVETAAAIAGHEDDLELWTGRVAVALQGELQHATAIGTDSLQV